MCSILEDKMELTLSEFQAIIEKQHENVYLSLMAESKLQEKYKDEISFVTSSGNLTLKAILQKHGVTNEKFLKQMKQSA